MSHVLPRLSGGLEGSSGNEEKRYGPPGMGINREFCASEHSVVQVTRPEPTPKTMALRGTTHTDPVRTESLSGGLSTVSTGIFDSFHGFLSH